MTLVEQRLDGRRNFAQIGIVRTNLMDAGHREPRGGIIEPFGLQRCYSVSKLFKLCRILAEGFDIFPWQDRSGHQVLNTEKNCDDYAQRNQSSLTHNFILGSKVSGSYRFYL